MSEAPPVRLKRSRIQWTPSAIALLAANLVPVAGVLLFGWDLFSVVLLYWLENAVIGVFNVVKMAVNRTQEPGKLFMKLFMIPFFCVHYGGFLMGHGVFVFAVFGREYSGGMGLPDPRQMVDTVISLHLFTAVVALVASHGYSFVVNYIRGGEWKDKLMVELMFAPYKRVVVLHVFILGGAFLVEILGAPKLGILLLTVLKIGADLLAHGKSHDTELTKAKQRMRQFYAQGLDKKIRSEGPEDWLVEGYRRDRTWEKSLQRPAKFGCIAGLALAVIGVLLIKTLPRPFGFILLGAGMILALVSIVWFNIRRHAACPHCGHEVESEDRDVPPGQMHAMEQMTAYRGSAGETLVKGDDEGTPTVTRMLQRWFVCRRCRVFILAKSRVAKSAAIGADEVEALIKSSTSYIDD